MNAYLIGYMGKEADKSWLERLTLGNVNVNFDPSKQWDTLKTWWEDMDPDTRNAVIGGGVGLLSAPFLAQMGPKGTGSFGRTLGMGLGTTLLGTVAGRYAGPAIESLKSTIGGSR